MPGRGAYLCRDRATARICPTELPGAAPRQRGGSTHALRCACADRPRAPRIGEPMSKKRVHEIAKEQGVSSKELLEKLAAAGVAAKAAASSVEEADALRVAGRQRRLATATARQAAAPAGAGTRPHSAPAAGNPERHPLDRRRSGRDEHADGGRRAGEPPRLATAPGRAASGCVPHATRAPASARPASGGAGRTPACGDRLAGLAPPAGRTRPTSPCAVPVAAAAVAAPTTRRSPRSTPPRWRPPT